MFNRQQITTVDRSVNFPSTINVHEHKAPTDESVKLLREMEEKALDDIVLKISELRSNKFSYVVVFTRLATLDLIPKGILYIRFNCNGKEYQRKVNCSSSILSLCSKYPKETRMMDLDGALQRYILFQISFLIAQILLDIDSSQLMELFSMDAMADAYKFNLDTLSDEIEYGFIENNK